MLGAQVYDLIAVSGAALAASQPASPDDVRSGPPLLAFSAETRSQSVQLKQFPCRNLYRHPQVVQTTDLAKQVVRELFAAYMVAPQEMPTSFSADTAADVGLPTTAVTRARVVADYIAGMTDRFAAREHERLTGRRLFTQMAE